MASVDEASGAVGGTAEQARELSANIAGAKELISELSGQLAALGVENRASQASGAASDAEALAGQANMLADALEQLRARVEALRGLLTTHSGGRTAVAVSGSGPASPQPHDPKARDPDRVAAIRRIGWPRNSKGRTSARGLLYDGSGNPVLHQQLKPLRGENVYNTPDLKDEWRRREVATSWHVEGGVAAYMRGTGTKEMTLWLNIPACGGYRRPDPNGCHENLPKILPPGYKLHVRVEGEDGSYQLNTYRGTGEALKRSE
jgi:hypothetical protein